MNQFVVPQFIDVQAKIIGPVTVRQFVIALVGGFFAVLAFKLADTGLFVILFLVDAALVFLFGFFKVNGRPFHQFIFSVFKMLNRPSIRVWMTRPTDRDILLVHANTTSPSAENLLPQKQLTASRLQELSLVVDTGGMYKIDEQ